jgi:phospholipase/carboxylesterase
VWSQDLGFAHRFDPGGRPDAATLLLLHGTGGDEEMMVPLGRRLASGAHLLSPRGNVLEDGVRNRYFRRHDEGVFDTDDLRHRAHELADFVGAATARYQVRPETVVAAGFSNGANIAGAVLLLRPETLRGAVLFAPMVPLRPEALPDLSGAAVFISAGRRDPICPPELAEELATLLTDAGAAVELRFHPGAHEVTAGQVDAAAGWMTKLLAATTADPGGIA